MIRDLTESYKLSFEQD